MKQFCILLLTAVVFLRCNPEDVSSQLSVDLIGQWKYDTGQRYLDDEGNDKPIINTIEFVNTNRYNVSSLNIPQNFPLLMVPNISGSWEFDQSKMVIKLFQTQHEILIENGFEYYWEIVELTSTTLNVKVTDKAGNFVHQRSYTKDK